MALSSFASAALQFAVIGTVISIIIEYTKQFLDKSGHRTVYALLISFLGGLVIYFSGYIPETWYTIALGVIGAVNTMYLILIQYVPLNTPPETQPVTQTPSPAQPTAAATQ